VLSWTSERQRARKAAANERQPQRAERAIYMERAEAFLNQRTSQRAERAIDTALGASSP
jgi:hypothetical protein